MSRLLPLAGPARPDPSLPLVVSYGAGVDSTAVLVGLAARGIRPDYVLFADTGSEHPETYDFLPVIDAWLASVGFPRLTIVRNRSPRTGYVSLEVNCCSNETLPSQAFRGGQPGGGACSARWKHEPMDRWLFRAGVKQRVRAIGYDNGKQDRKRAGRGSGEAKKHKRDLFWYPLQDWGWDRARCEQEIAAAGLPVPRKSSCFFCPAMKAPEIRDLAAKHPALLRRAIQMENGARAGKHGLRSVKGLGRSFSWGAMAEAEGLLVGVAVEAVAPTAQGAGAAFLLERTTLS